MQQTCKQEPTPFVVHEEDIMDAQIDAAMQHTPGLTQEEVGRALEAATRARSKLLEAVGVTYRRTETSGLGKPVPMEHALLVILDDSIRKKHNELDSENPRVRASTSGALEVLQSIREYVYGETLSLGEKGDSV